MSINKSVMELVNEFSKLQEVKGILLAGSHSTKTNDKNSDYDIYIYVSNEIPIKNRKEITDKFFKYIELNNKFWETEDDGILKEDDIPVEIIYRSVQWIEESLQRTLVECQADVGYTTCIWSNFINSIILYDRDGQMTTLQEKYKVPYPKKLKDNIIKKNYPILMKEMFSYYDQINKALKREDFISVNHRVAALFASYFDIIFAINEMPHPGEKKIIRIVKENNLNVPKNMEIDISDILSSNFLVDTKILVCIERLIKNLDEFLKENNMCCD